MTDRELLVEQLAVALADAAAGRDDYFEVAVLAGLLSRFAAVDEASDSLAEQQVIAEARKVRDQGTLRASMPDSSAATDIAEEIFAVRSDHEEDEKRDMLLDLDELCAGAWFIGDADPYAAAVETITTAIIAHPAWWRDQTPWVAQALANAPPLPSDRMLAVFRTISTLR